MNKQQELIIMSNLYSEILSHIAQTRPVTVETVIRGDSGLIAEGLQRRLVPGVIYFVFILFLSIPHSIWDLSSLIRD